LPIAPTYGEEIFDVLHHDKKGIIRSTIKKFASQNKTVMDIGCAIGKWLPVLAPLFKKVVAVDISAKNLAIAKKLYPGYTNVEYLRADMSGKRTKVPKCDFAICINAILTPSLKERTIFFESLQACVKKDGHIIITVPSLESYLLTSIVQVQYKIDRSLYPAKTSPKKAARQWEQMRQGNADIDNVPHKHYLKEELELLLSKAGFTAEKFHKI
jgi:2-polyprenyl-3-methyl-5-hydroxy-6-metoxy-1,4-benzoquinol methylase